MLLLVQVHILLGHKNLSLRRVNLKMVQAVLIVKRVLLVTNLYLSAVVLTSVKGYWPIAISGFLIRLSWSHSIIFDLLGLVLHKWLLYFKVSSNLACVNLNLYQPLCFNVIFPKEAFSITQVASISQGYVNVRLVMR